MIIHKSVAAKDDIKVNLKGNTTVLVTTIGANTNAYGAWLVQGYGASNTRIHVATIQKGDLCSYAIGTDASVTFLNNVDSNYAFLVLSGSISTE